MGDSSNFTLVQEWIKTALAYLSGLGGLSALLYILKRLLERTVDARFQKKFAQIKHDFELEQQKMSVVYQNQKDSFRNVLVGMHNAIEAIEHNVAGIGEDWRPISQKDVDAFSRVMARESLFMDSGSDLALRLFRETMNKAAQYDYEIPTSDEVWQSYDQMNFIAKRLAQHFRTRVGLDESTPDPLLEVSLLGACRLVNSYLRTKSILNIDKNTTADQLVGTARNNPEVLISELEQLQARSRDNPFSFEVATQVDHYLQRLKTRSDKRST